MRTRFAPSPTGPLHLGHAYSAIVAHDLVRAAGGQFLLRIEDIDRARSKPAWERQLLDDLSWLGLSWDEAPVRQSDRMLDYAKALDRLWAMGLLYPCSCTRRDVEMALSAPQEGVEAPTGPDGPIYPGTCRPSVSGAPRGGNGPGRPTDVTLRLHVKHAAQALAAPLSDKVGGREPTILSYRETGIGPQGRAGLIEFAPADLITQVGDFVVARRDMGTSYHLSVVLDDAAQGITDVVRGADLSAATRIHVLLQALLQLPTPTYHHHRLIRDDQGKRLAKRDDARALSKYRAEGATPADIRRLVGL